MVWEMICLKSHRWLLKAKSQFYFPVEAVEPAKLILKYSSPLLPSTTFASSSAMARTCQSQVFVLRAAKWRFACIALNWHFAHLSTPFLCKFRSQSGNTCELLVHSPAVIECPQHSYTKYLTFQDLSSIKINIIKFRQHLLANYWQICTIYGQSIMTQLYKLNLIQKMLSRKDFWLQFIQNKWANGKKSNLNL